MVIRHTGLFVVAARTDVRFACIRAAWSARVGDDLVVISAVAQPEDTEFRWRQDERLTGRSRRNLIFGHWSPNFDRSALAIGLNAAKLTTSAPCTLTRRAADNRLVRWLSSPTKYVRQALSIEPKHSAGGGLRQHALKVRVVDRAEQELGVTIRFHHHKRRLGRDTEASEDGSGIVADLRERQRVPVDESLERRIVARPCDADEIDPPGPLLCCRFDRRSFCVTDRSSGCPEPKRGCAAGVVSASERAAPDQWRAEPQQFGDGVRAGRRTGHHGCRVRRRWRGVTGGQRDEQDDRGQRPTSGPRHGTRSVRQRTDRNGHQPILHRSARDHQSGVDLFRESFAPPLGHSVSSPGNSSLV